MSFPDYVMLLTGACGVIFFVFGVTDAARRRRGRR